MNKAQINKAMELADSYADARLSSWTELNVSGKRAALRAHLESCGVQASTGWIATKDQMPPEGVRVFWLDEGSNRVGYDTWCGDDYRWNTSHWMHIPPLVAQAVPQAVPDYMVLVPREPDETMESVGDMNLMCGAKDVYQAMLAAAPQPARSAQPERKPLTEVQKNAMWVCVRQSLGGGLPEDYYRQGIDDAESEHGIKE